MIDYKAHSSAGKLLGQLYTHAQFDVVIDAIGTQDIWENCAAFVKPMGAYITVGIANKDYTWSSMLECLWLMMLKNPWTPIIFGGVPRRLERITAVVNEESMRELGEAVKDGTLRGTAWETWDMENVKRAYNVLLQKKARGKIIIRVNGEET